MRRNPAEAAAICKALMPPFSEMLARRRSQNHKPEIRKA
jgi:hypothetical protein